MGRDLTPQEREEFELKRRKQIEENCKRFGISAEERERIYREACEKRQEPSEKTRAETALKIALYQIGKGFLESLKTENHREALDTVDDLDGMSDGEFSELLTKRMSVLDEEEREAARDVISRRINQWSESEPLSLREVILLDLQSIIRGHYYRAENQTTRR